MLPTLNRLGVVVLGCNPITGDGGGDHKFKVIIGHVSNLRPASYMKLCLNCKRRRKEFHQMADGLVTIVN